MYVSRRRRRHAMGLAAILGLGVIALAPLDHAQATTPLGTQTRLSVTGADGDPNLDATDASVAYNPAADQYLVVWQSGPQTGESEILARLLDAAGTPLGAEFAVSDMGPPLAVGFEAETPAVAYNTRRNEYLVVWRGDDSAGPLFPGEFEIFAQRLTAGGDEVGANDRRISEMGPSGDDAYSAEDPAVAYNPTSDQYLVAWEGDDDDVPLVDDEDEIFVQRLNANGAQVGADDRRVSDMGPNGDVDFSADNPAVAHNPTSNQYLVAWEGDDDRGPLVDNEREIYVQRLSAKGVQRGANDRRISDMGPVGERGLRGRRPEPRVQPRDRRVPGGLGRERRHRRARGRGGRDLHPAALRQRRPGRHRRPADLPDGPRRRNGVRRHHPQRGGRHSDERVPGGLGRRGRHRRAGHRRERDLRPAPRPDGAEIGGDDVRVSAMGVDGSDRSDGLAPAVAYGSQANEYLIAWHGDPDPPLANDEFEVFARRFGAGAAARARSARPCRRRPRRARATPTTSRSPPASS